MAWASASSLAAESARPCSCRASASNSVTAARSGMSPRSDVVPIATATQASASWGLPSAIATRQSRIAPHSVMNEPNAVELPADCLKRVLSSRASATRPERSQTSAFA